MWFRTSILSRRIEILLVTRCYRIGFRIGLLVFTFLPLSSTLSFLPMIRAVNIVENRLQHTVFSPEFSHKIFPKMVFLRNGITSFKVVLIVGYFLSYLSLQLFYYGSQCIARWSRRNRLSNSVWCSEVCDSEVISSGLPSQKEDILPSASCHTARKRWDNKEVTLGCMPWLV